MANTARMSGKLKVAFRIKRTNLSLVVNVPHTYKSNGKVLYFAWGKTLNCKKLPIIQTSVGSKAQQVSRAEWEPGEKQGG